MLVSGRVSLSNSIAIKKIHCFSEKKWSKKDDPLLLQKYTFELAPFVRGRLFVFGAEVEKERGAQAAEGLSAAWIRKVWTGKVREVPNVGFLKGQKEALDLVHPGTMCVYIEYICMYTVYLMNKNHDTHHNHMITCPPRNHWKVSLNLETM